MVIEGLAILIVDDDRLSRKSTAAHLADVGYRSAEADGAEAALALLEQEPFDVVLTDLRMPGMDGLELLREVKARHPDTEVILMTAYGSVENAVQAMHEGALDYLVKPFQLDELELRLQRVGRLLSSQREAADLRRMLGEAVESHGLVGRSPALQEVRRRIESFAQSSAPVLITGETGTGKEVVSRAIHRASGRRGAFVAVGCGAIPKELAESEIFGHEKGAFTGAHRRRKGSFERAHGGTLLLDDIDDLELELQVKLLRVLQEGRLTRVGGGEELEVDARVIATTKIDLAEAVAEESFRPDLFYRLRALEIRLPPLREREGDVALLAHHFLQALAQREGGEPCRLTPEALEVLRNYPWPGNVRELAHAMEAAVVLSKDGTIDTDALPEFLGAAARGPSRWHTLHLEGCREVPFTEVLEGVEVELLRWALERAGGRQTEAARLLNLPRTTFQSKLAHHRHLEG